MPIGKPTAASASLQGVNIWYRMLLRGEVSPRAGQDHGGVLTGVRGIGSMSQPASAERTPRVRLHETLRRTPTPGDLLLRPWTTDNERILG